MFIISRVLFTVSVPSPTYDWRRDAATGRNVDPGDHNHRRGDD